MHEKNNDHVQSIAKLIHHVALENIEGKGSVVYG